MKKCIENYSEDELKNLLPHIPYETVEIVYGYMHRGRMPVERYCEKQSISKSTLYRYIRIVETELNK